MKTFKTLLLPFLSGILITALIHFSYQCKKDDNTPEDQGIQADLVQMGKDAQLAEDAFLSGDLNQVKLVMTPEAFEFFSETLEAQSPDKLISFGNAFTDRDLRAYSAIYAEYEFSEDGKTYTVGFSIQADKSWKITRL